MNCPSCHTGALVPGQLEQGLPCSTCQSCSGSLLALSAYLDWLHAGEHHVSSATSFESADSKLALLCPRCSRIMVKFKVLADAEHNLDFCFSCEEVWLDRGEWDYLKSQNLHTHITGISTESWQRRIREHLAHAIRTGKHRHELGEAVFAEARRFKQWLAAQPHRDEILRYLNAEEPAAPVLPADEPPLRR